MRDAVKRAEMAVVKAAMRHACIESRADAEYALSATHHRYGRSHDLAI